jgi:predicted metal-dependent peptidase
VNQYVVHRLPSTAVTIKGFAWMPPDLTCELYYDLLKIMSDEDLSAIVPDRSCGHARWDDDDDGPSGGRFKDLIDGVCEEALARAEREGTIGQISDATREIIARARRTPRSDPFWKRALRIFCARTLRSSVRPTTQRESRRYGAERTRWDGPIVPGLRRGRAPAVLIAVDTSGSINNATLTTFFAQVTRIAATGARIHVVECDLAVQRDYPWDGKAPNEVKGRGGTAFDPVFAWLRGAGRKLHLTGCVYLTDGEAARPTIRPPCPLLWVITPNGTHGNVDFGRAVTMPA